MRAPGKSTKVSTLVGRALPLSLRCLVLEKWRKASFKVSVNYIWNRDAPIACSVGRKTYYPNCTLQCFTDHQWKRCLVLFIERSVVLQVEDDRVVGGFPQNDIRDSLQASLQPSLQTAKFASRHNLRPPQEITTDPPGQDKSGRNARTTSWGGRCSSGRIHLATSAKILLFSKIYSATATFAKILVVILENVFNDGDGWTWSSQVTHVIVSPSLAAV